MTSMRSAQDQWRRDVKEWRRQKDAFFAGSPQSPLQPPQKASFEGLKYFEPNPVWDVRAKAVRLAAGKPIMIPLTHNSPPRPYERYAKASFRSPQGEDVVLHLYAPLHDHHGHEPHEPHDLFLPFRDATSGPKTYGAGRYVEVVNIFDTGVKEATLRIDFNYAYNPFCAYNMNYVCPLPPQENWLKVAVEAGELYDASLDPNAEDA
jgi:uncharacterized protein